MQDPAGLTRLWRQRSTAHRADCVAASPICRTRGQADDAPAGDHTRVRKQHWHWHAKRSLRGRDRRTGAIFAAVQATCKCLIGKPLLLGLCALCFVFCALAIAEGSVMTWGVSLSLVTTNLRFRSTDRADMTVEDDPEFTTPRLYLPPHLQRDFDPSARPPICHYSITRHPTLRPSGRVARGRSKNLQLGPVRMYANTATVL